MTLFFFILGALTCQSSPAESKSFWIIEWDGKPALGQLFLKGTSPVTGFSAVPLAGSSLPVPTFSFEGSPESCTFATQGSETTQTCQKGEEKFTVIYSFENPFTLDFQHCTPQSCTAQSLKAFDNTAPGKSIDILAWGRTLAGSYTIDKVAGHPAKPTADTAEILSSAKELTFFLPYCEENQGCDPGERNYTAATEAKVLGPLTLLRNGPKEWLLWFDFGTYAIALDPYYTAFDKTFPLEYRLRKKT